MKRGLPRLSLWTFSRWRKFLLPTDLNDGFVVTAYLTDNLISELVLTYSTSSRQALTRRSRTRFFASGASHCDTATDFSQATRLPLQSCG